MSQLSKFDESGANVGRAGRDLLIAILLVALAVLPAAAVILIGREGGNDVAPAVVDSPAVPFDYDEAAELSAMRWQEMARFYERSGLLLNDAVDPEAVVDPSLFTTAPVWEQARAYELNAASAAGLPWPDGIAPEGSMMQFYAEPYLDQAGSSGNDAGSMADYDAYYTEKYWKMVAEAESRREALPELPVVPDGFRLQPR